jgi:hypothetical protein
MRKLFVFALMMGVLSFAVVPAFAGYEETDVMLDQADHSTFAPNWASIGDLADENPSYGNGTITLPYAASIASYDGGCPTNVVDANGDPIGSAYNCADGLEALDPDLIIQDLFTAVT